MVAWDYLRKASYGLVEYGAEIRESELRVVYHGRGGQFNDSDVRLYGADNPDAMRGIYLDGIVCDEFGDMDPRIWSEVLRPALADRLGWAVFIGTPKGHNRFYDIWQQSLKEDDWFSLTLKASETGLISERELASARTDMSAEQYAQEFECSFEAAIVGAYYGKLMQQAEEDKRICGVPHHPGTLVHTAWDLGAHDSTVIWFVQIIGREVHLVDYYESSGVGMEHYVRLLHSRPYTYGTHILPHDAKAPLQAEQLKTRVEILEKLGLRNLEVLLPGIREDGIEQARVLIPQCWFDKVKCARGIEALKQYRQQWDETRKTFHNKPLHDWSSHAADAFRYLAMGQDRLGSRKGFDRKIKYPPRKWV